MALYRSLTNASRHSQTGGERIVYRRLALSSDGDEVRVLKL